MPDIVRCANCLKETYAGQAACPHCHAPLEAAPPDQVPKDSEPAPMDREPGEPDAMVGRFNGLFMETTLSDICASILFWLASLAFLYWAISSGIMTVLWHWWALAFVISIPIWWITLIARRMSGSNWDRGEGNSGPNSLEE